MDDSFRMRVFSIGVLVLALSGCSGSEETPQPQAQQPVIVVQAPEPADDGATYDELAWDAMGNGTTGARAETPSSEPYEIVALLREFDPQLTDAPKDQQGDAPSDDLLSAFVAMDDVNLYGRLLTRGPLVGDDAHEIRFWIEQGGNMVSLEIKIGPRLAACELADVKTPEDQEVVPGCFWVGNALDFRVPISAVPKIIDTAEPYWVSGFQTCCADEERNQPFDEIEGAQEVWRVPGAAADVDTGGGGEAPEAPVTPETGG